MRDARPFDAFRGVANRPLTWLVASVAVASAAVVTRGHPTTDADAGIFLSVAGRIIAGDELYRDAFDNKDPLFYYVQAAAVWLFGWRGPFLLDIGWLIVASIGARLLLRAVTGDLVVAVFGQLVYPLLLTGLYYYSGYSATPGLSLLPLCAYLVYARRPKLAGCVAAVIFFLKVTLFPIAGMIALVELGFFGRATRRRRGRDVVFFVGTTAAACATIFLVLVLRGEATAYLATLRENSAYASSGLTVNGWPPGIQGHLRVVWHFLPAPTLLVAASAVIGLLFAGSAAVRSYVLRSRLFVLSVVASLSTLLVLAQTALWDHHLAVLHFPLLCGAALAVECVRTAARRASGRLLARLAVGFVVGGCLVVAAWPQHAVANLRQWTESPQTSVSDALQLAAQSTYRHGSPVSYAHLGANDEDAAGAFLGAPFRLACARFHQYPFTPPRALRETLACLKKQRTLLIAVTPSFAIDSYTYWGRGTPPAWHWFVRAGRAFLRANCELLVTRPGVLVYHCGPPRP